MNKPIEMGFVIMCASLSKFFRLAGLVSVIFFEIGGYKAAGYSSSDQHLFFGVLYYSLFRIDDCTNDFLRV